MNTIASAALLLAVPATLLSATGVQDDDVSVLVSRLAARAERSLEADSLDGLAIVVSVGDEVLLQRGWGRLPGGTLASAMSPVRAAPLVEPLAVIAALQLVDEGKVDLDAPIGTYIEGLEWEGATVTVHHLLSQTSGLIGWAGAFEAKGGVGADVARLVALVKEQGLQSAPGDCFEYSETNALLVGALVEAVTKKPLGDVITERILAKSSVEASGFDLDDAPPAQDEAGCSLEVVGEQISVSHPAHLFREDEFCVSALDMVRIRRALSAGKLTGDAMIEAIMEPKRLNDGTELGYGYGFSLGTLGTFDSVTTGGSADGTTVHLAYYPEPDVTVVVLVAAERAPLMSLERDLVRLVLDLPLPGVQDLELDPVDAKAYVGQYQVGCTTYRVAETPDGHLTVTVADRPVYRLLFQGRRSFVAQRDADVRFDFEVQNGDKIASKLVINEHGLRSDAVRFL